MLFLNCDGTLLSDEKRHYAAYTSTLEMPDIGGVPIPEREYWSLKREGRPWEGVLRRSKVFPGRFTRFKERFEERLEAPEFLSLDELKPGTETFLGKVYTKTPIVLLAQRRERAALDNELEDLGVRKYFVEVLSGVPRETRRKDPDLQWKHKAALIRARYRLLPTDALYLGDTEIDVQAARSLGFGVWLIEGGHRTKTLQIKANPDRIEANLPGSLKHMLPGGRWQR